MNTRAILSLVLLVSVCLMVSPALAQSDTPDSANSESSASSTGSEPKIAQPEIVEEESEFDVELEGRKTWTIRYGLGHPLGLATSGMSPGQLTLDQTLTVDVVGEALSVLTIEAHYNDQLPGTMQSLALYLDTERLDGVLGDFTFGSAPDFAAYNKKMKGLELEYLIGDAVLTAVVSKTEGVSETVV
ncbi:MAG: hypothetical protein V3T03_02350, partial [Candidatus Bipolaricaulota bacterium]